jgi:hypothetical protein
MSAGDAMKPTPSGNVVKLHFDISGSTVRPLIGSPIAARQECVKTGPCPCEAPCRWAVQALYDVQRAVWPTHALRLVYGGDASDLNILTRPEPFSGRRIIGAQIEDM